MMKKTISAICAVLLTLTAVSCQKTNTCLLYTSPSPRDS